MSILNYKFLYDCSVFSYTKNTKHLPMENIMILEMMIIDMLIVVIFGAMSLGLCFLPWTTIERRQLKKELNQKLAFQMSLKNPSPSGLQPQTGSLCSELAG